MQDLTQGGVGEHLNCTSMKIEPQLSKIMASKSKNEEALVLLQADKSLNLQEVIDVIDIGNKLDVKVVLFTKKSEK